VALERAGEEVANALDAPATEWRLVSNRKATVDALVSVDAVGVRVGSNDAVAPFEYLGFFPATE
jgi:hypothetical protein